MKSFLSNRLASNEFVNPNTLIYLLLANPIKMVTPSDDFEEAWRKLEEAAEALREELKQVAASKRHSQTP